MTDSERAIQKTSETESYLVGSKTAEKISKATTKNNPEHPRKSKTM